MAFESAKRGITMVLILAAVALGIMLGRGCDGSKPQFSTVEVSKENLEDLKPKEDVGLITSILTDEPDPDQVATARGGGAETLGGFCGPIVDRALARAEAQRQADEVPAGIDLADKPTDPAGADPGVEADGAELATALLFDAGRYKGSTFELFTVDNAGDASRLLYRGVHRPLEFGVRDNGVPWIRGSRTWFIKPALKGGSLAGAGASAGALMCGSQCAIGGAVIGGIAGAIWGAD